MEEKKHNNKIIAGMIVGIITLTTLVMGATYAYFSVSTTNSFGTSTVNATAETLGSVTLVGGNATLSLNLSGADMMQENLNTYYATPTGDPSVTEYIADIGHTQVTGDGYYNCTYTLNVAASATSSANNLYTAFQGMTGKSTNQIALTLYDMFNGDNYDFYTANLFPTTYTGTLYGVSASDSESIFATFYLYNNNLNQNALQGKDITLTITATSFSCTAVDEPVVSYHVYDSANLDNGVSTGTNSNSGLNYYLKSKTFGNATKYEACGIFNNTEICLKPGTWSNASTYKSEMEAAGATCNSTYVTDGFLNCTRNSVSCGISNYGATECVEETNNRCMAIVGGGVRCEYSLTDLGGGGVNYN